jgi:hypothetical protein
LVASIEQRNMNATRQVPIPLKLSNIRPWMGRVIRQGVKSSVQFSDGSP